MLKMAKIGKDILKRIADEGFFDSPKDVNEVVSRLDQKGFTITGKKKGLVSQLLTFLCQDGLLEREKGPDSEWRYKKIENVKEQEKSRERSR